MVKGIDLQHALAKTLDSERIQEIGKQQLESAQKQFAREFKNLAAQKTRTVQENPKPEEARIRGNEDAEKKGGRKQRGKNKARQKSQPPEDENLSGDGCGKIIDIKA